MSCQSLKTILDFMTFGTALLRHDVDLSFQLYNVKQQAVLLMPLPLEDDPKVFVALWARSPKQIATTRFTWPT